MGPVGQPSRVLLGCAFLALAPPDDAAWALAIHPRRRRSAVRIGSLAIITEAQDKPRALGAAPVRRGQPGYTRHLDRDNEGVGCE